MTPVYRKDIDGLRAIAVLSVLLFHAGFELFSGGYVGVDVFFVISGYLITTIIVREIETEKFSIAAFYERRFRRILPALLVVVIVSFLFGLFLLHPKHLYDLAQSVVATGVFSSNILFYFETGYFNGPAEFKPLLHTWSLAVEEQYYIFFPLLMILIAKKFERKYMQWLVWLTLASLMLCIIGTRIDASAAFYMIPARAWEFLVGGLLAINLLPKIKSAYICEVLSITGLLLVLFSVMNYSSVTVFPGVAAIVPALGTMLIIHSGLGANTFVSKILSLKPIVFIGLISYSLYLWHWPVVVYSKYVSIIEPDPSQLALMISVMFVLSILTWKFVEIPFRTKRIFEQRRPFFLALSSVSFAVIALGFFIINMNGLQARYGHGQLALGDPEWQHWGECQDVKNKLDSKEELCDLGTGDSKESFILWGDSHARALASSVNESAKQHGHRGKIATQDACPPLLYVDRKGRLSCHEFNQVVMNYIVNSPNIKTVFLAARWALSATGMRYVKGTKGDIVLVDLQTNRNLKWVNLSLFEIGLRRTINQLKKLGKVVVLVNQVPEIKYDVEAANFISRLFDRKLDGLISPSVSEYSKRMEKTTSVFQSLVADVGVDMVYPSTYLCVDKYCKVSVDGVLLYRDAGHLSTFGSKYVSGAFDVMLSGVDSKL